MRLSRRDLLLRGAPLLGGLAASRIMLAQAQPQELTGPMASASDVYRPVKLEPKPDARPSMTPVERDDLEHQIKCQCGCVLDVFTCRTTDFSCSVSPAMHGDVLALVDGGYSGPEILAAFQAAYGERVLMAPVKSGFNLLGYTMPFLALGAGAIAIGAVLRRWKARAPAAVAPVPQVSATSDELARLEQAVRQDV
ncbi:MAG TPA: cytochrome c-type biogenesis protein CcmH [Gemmatimonadaceae bacterium]|nr:cytochrome c-type biogenesis protein CcmH [Gemmatimonadaceae bacterium]